MLAQPTWGNIGGIWTSIPCTGRRSSAGIFPQRALFLFSAALEQPGRQCATCLSVAGGPRSACCGGTSAGENAPNRHMWARACARVHNPAWRWARHIINSCHHVPFFNPITSSDSQERRREQQWRGALFRNLDINTSTGRTLRVRVCVRVSRYLRAWICGPDALTFLQALQAASKWP